MASNQENVKLYGMMASPFVSRVEIALTLKGVEYQYQLEKGGNLSDTLKKYNPVYKKVPVFVHNDKPLSESLVILEYIDETWKQNPILPSDPYKRAVARFWTRFIDDKVNIIFYSFCRVILVFFFLSSSLVAKNLPLKCISEVSDIRTLIPTYNMHCLYKTELTSRERNSRVFICGYVWIKYFTNMWMVD